jgi:hypothetical protein
MTENHKHKLFLADLLKAKTPLEGGKLYGLAGRWNNRFGFDLCAEVFQGMPDLKHNPNPVPYIEKILQYKAVGKNPQPVSLGSILSQMGR